MRWVLVLFALVTGGASLLLMIVALNKGGSDMHFIGAGVFMTAFVVCLGLIGVMARLEHIRDRKL